MSFLRRLRRELGSVRQAFRSGRPLGVVRARRAARERRIADDAAALGCDPEEMRSAHDVRRGGVAVLATRFGPVHLRRQDTDLLAIRQVLVDREYDLAGLAQMDRLRAIYAAHLARGRRPVIIDAGANIGAASLWFASVFPDAAIVAVEPEPANAAIARLNLAALPHARLVEAAIGAAPGTVGLRTVENQGWAARTHRDTGGEGGIAVVTVPDLVAAVPQGRPFIVKVDIEGFESDLFDRNIAWVEQAAAIIVEPHDWMLPGAGTSQALQAALFGKGREVLISGENLIVI
ncbi:hypothetical protein ASE86_14965 [Sphingomonas sp. Leaf33]|uniref:FkbM family methyltransferase n=1 Tax=Sphingomonas sp. Leaf33 TaxID=1736215 RepID=UPI0006FBE312|nr:FkbM family methyltransferase [Sphingomonas sp. Leaf33]KQN21262.1 hypothetical protein ASE86_14965 [Sphingomonas sp. Leaf33]